MDKFVENFRFAHQPDDFSCGRSSVVMVLWAFGIGFDPEELDEQLEISPETGTRQAGIVQAARFYGLSVKEVSFANRKPSLRNIKSKLSKGYLGVCSVDNNGHWIVLRGIRPKSVFVADPNPKAPKRQLLRTVLTRLSKGSIIWVRG